MARARRHRGGSVTVLYRRFLGPYPDATLHTVLVLDFVNMFLEFTGRMPTLAEASHALHMPPPRIEHHYRILEVAMPNLIEINPGTWVRPDRVTSIVARGEFPAFKEGAKPFKPSVHVALDDRHEQIGWTFDDVEDAKAFAAKLVATVNDALALKDPP